MKCITQRGESLKFTCLIELQKSQIFSATYLNGVDIAIVPFKPRMEERRRQEGIHPRQKRVVILGVPEELTEREILEDTEAIDAYRIKNKNKW